MNTCFVAFFWSSVEYTNDYWPLTLEYYAETSVEPFYALIISNKKLKLHKKPSSRSIPDPGGTTVRGYQWPCEDFPPFSDNVA
jgi:hypothetical protein